MTRRRRANLVALAGPLCSGKTTLAVTLAEMLGARIVSAREELQRLGTGTSRLDLQRAGARVDQRTNGAWLAAAVPDPTEDRAVVIVDSARTTAQIEALRATGRPAVVVYLGASVVARRRRYMSRGHPADENVPFEEADAGEPADLVELAGQAEIRVETDRTPPHAVVSAVLRELEPAQL